MESPYTYDIPKELPKKENSYSLPKTDTYEQKYALPTDYFSKVEKEVKKNYLQKLDIKESITVEEPKPKESYVSIQAINPIQTYGNNLR